MNSTFNGINPRIGNPGGKGSTSSVAVVPSSMCVVDRISDSSDVLELDGNVVYECADLGGRALIGDEDGDRLDEDSRGAIR